MRRLINTIGSLALSLMLALVVWVGATSAENPTVTQDYPDAIPIQLENQPANTVVVKQEDSTVRVRFRTLQNNLESIRVSDFQVYADLSNAHVGEDVEVPVIVQARRRYIQLISYTPTVTTVHLEEYKEKTVPVRANVVDFPPLGYAARDPVLSPSEVVVSGPAPAVNQVAYVSADIWIRGAVETINRSLTVTPFDDAGTTVSGVSVNPASVNAEVVISERSGYRTVSIRVNIEGEVAPLYSVSKISVTPTKVTLIGVPSVVNELPGYVDTEAINIDGATQSISRRVSLQLPPGVTVVPEDTEATASQTVQVDIEVVPLISSRTMKVTVAPQGLSPDLQAVLSPETVDALLSGPLVQLQELTPEQVEATVNLLNLAPGTHRLVPNVIVPEGIDVTGVVPEAVEVTITQAPVITPEPEATGSSG